jgi:hypothetical protein
LRVAVKLVKVADQTNLWTESYERNIGSILAFHGDVSRDVARRIRIQLTPEKSETLSEARPVDPDAYEAYLKGLYFWNKFTNRTFTRALNTFNRPSRKTSSMRQLMQVWLLRTRISSSLESHPLPIMRRARRQRARRLKSTIP